jgi:Protein of unknown function (DUF3592)
MRTKSDNFLIIICISLLISCTGLSLYFTYSLGSDIYKAYVLSGKWKYGTAEIISSKSMVGCGKSGKHHFPVVIYKYYVEKTLYTNNKIWFGSEYCDRELNVAAIVKKFPELTKAPVYFNHKTPNESVLIKELSSPKSTIAFFLISMIMPALGIKILWESMNNKFQINAKSITHTPLA